MNRPRRLHHQRSGRTLLISLWLLVMVVILASGCSLKNPHALGTMERAQFWHENDHFQEAADAYEIFVRQNPTDTLAARAQFNKARAYMAVKELPLAAVELQILAQDYPTSSLVEDALFHEGECYYFQVGRLERDVTPAYEARLHWLNFSRQYPTSEFMPQVRQYMQEIADLMVRKQMRAVDIYGQLRRYKAQGIVLDRILNEEPTATILDEVLLRRAKVAERLDDTVKAREMYQQLLDEHPDSQLKEAAIEALTKLPEVDATATDDATETS